MLLWIFAKTLKLLVNGLVCIFLLKISGSYGYQKGSHMGSVFLVKKLSFYIKQTTFIPKSKREELYGMIQTLLFNGQLKILYSQIKILMV